MPIRSFVKFSAIPTIPTQCGSISLGPLKSMLGTWKGTGFNLIFRPIRSAESDSFLELNLTNETLEVTEILGEIPNRGFLQDDIQLFGANYLQQVSDAVVKKADGTPAGLHIEPGIWLNIPSTNEPAEAASVARIASIPHGTSLLAQGSANVTRGPPAFEPVDITPTKIANDSDKVGMSPQTTLATPSVFRSAPADIVGVTQSMVDNPNSILTAFVEGKVIESATVIRITTVATRGSIPSIGGGISNIAFLAGGLSGPNANVERMEATFWISSYADGTGSKTLLQYSQKVILNFHGLSWPHVSVANLIKQ